MEVLRLITIAEHVAPTSDENVTVTDTEFSNVATRLYLPRKPARGLRRAVIYFHGGGWCVGQAGKLDGPIATERIGGWYFTSLNTTNSLGEGGHCHEHKQLFQWSTSVIVFYVQLLAWLGHFSWREEQN